MDIGDLPYEITLRINWFRADLAKKREIVLTIEILRDLSKVFYWREKY